MPVNTPHPDYTEHVDQWQRCRTTSEGSDAVKGEKQKYLPMLSGQSLGEYDAYLSRALFYNATRRTIDGLLGAVFRKQPEVEKPEALEELIEDVTATGTPLHIFAKIALREILTTGRYGVLVEMDDSASPGNRPYFTGYRAEQIINWRVEDEYLTMVVLSETAEEVDAQDPFKVNIIQQYRVLTLLGGEIAQPGQYAAQIWRKNDKDQDKWSIYKEFIATMRGMPLDYIPFCFIGPNTITPDVDDSPIIDLVDVNLSHFRSSADLEHGRHFTGLPTPWVAGFPETTVLQIGSSIAWVATDSNAKAAILEFTGQGLGALEKALEEKERKMAALGARLLEDQKNAQEAAATVALRHSGENATLASIANTLSIGLTRCLGWLAEWAGVSGEASIKLNTDYYPLPLDAQFLTALIALWQGGAISYSTFYGNLQRGELTRPGIKPEDELHQIGTETPMSSEPSEDSGPSGPSEPEGANLQPDAEMMEE